jgi:hypothetical protein
MVQEGFFGWVVFYRVGSSMKQCSGDIFWAWLSAGDSANEMIGVFLCVIAADVGRKITFTI